MRKSNRLIYLKAKDIYFILFTHTPSTRSSKIFHLSMRRIRRRRDAGGPDGPDGPRRELRRVASMPRDVARDRWSVGFANARADDDDSDKG